MAPLKSQVDENSSILDDEERAFPRGGASVLTPLEHRQIQIQATRDVLFEEKGQKNAVEIYGGDKSQNAKSNKRRRIEDSGHARNRDLKKRKYEIPNQGRFRVPNLNYKVSMSCHFSQRYETDLSYEVSYIWLFSTGTSGRNQ